MEDSESIVLSNDYFKSLVRIQQFPVYNHHSIQTSIPSYSNPFFMNSTLHHNNSLPNTINNCFYHSYHSPYDKPWLYSRTELIERDGYFNRTESILPVVQQLEFSPDGKILVGASSRSECLFVISSFENSKNSKTKHTSKDLIHLRASPVKKYGIGAFEHLYSQSTSDQWIVHGSNNPFDHTLRLLQLKDSRYIRYFRAHRDYVTCIRRVDGESAYSRMFVSASLDGSAHV
mmetsp:Transcript_6686/g.11944  ORF Transcript_6686/g.11944 Transcript_6686/m.11944 type:complete len:231 (-) Transcript_6686:21-713(-)